MRELCRARSSRARRTLRFHGVLALILFVGTGCDSGPAPDRWALFANFGRAAALEIAYAEPALRSQAEALAADLERIRGIDVAVRDGIRSDSNLVRPRLVLGTCADPSIARLAASIGVEVAPNGDGFTFQGRVHAGAHAAFVACLRDPDRPSLPLILCVGASADGLAERARDSLAPWNPRVDTWDGAGRQLEVELSIDGVADGATLVDHAARRAVRALDADTVRTPSVVYRVESTVIPARFAAYRRQVERSLELACEWLDCEGGVAIEAFVFGSAESFAGATGHGELARVDHVTQRVDVLLAEGMPSDAGAAIATATLLRALGPPAEAWMADGIGVAASGVYWGRRLGDWCALLRESGRVPTLDELRLPFESGLRGNDDPGERSPHVLVPMRALALRRAASLGQDLRAAWSGAAPLALDASALDGPALSERAREEREERGELARARAFHTGVALYPTAHVDAYARLSTMQSLAHAQSLGADAFSVTVQASFVPRERGLFSEPAIDGSSSDLALASALTAGNVLGLSKMLVIEPLVAPWSTWADGGRFVGEDENERFFTRFERLAVHYALLAELCGVDELCLGAGLRLASKTKVLDYDTEYTVELKALRDARWRQLVRAVRSVFAGAVTYGAHLRGEADEVGHWDAFDSIGLIGFSSLISPDGAAPTDGELRSRVHGSFKRARELGAAWGKPVAFVQNGFPSRSDAWARPAVPSGTPEPEAQRRYYDALARALRTDANLEAQVGVYLWNWSASPPSARAASAYTPQGRPAEAVLERIFHRE